MRWRSMLLTLAVACSVSLPASSLAATYTVPLGAIPAVTALGVGTNAQSHVGAGSWYKLYPGPKFETYVVVPTQLGTVFTVDQIASVTYHTLNNAANPSNVDFYMVLYTAPYGGGDATWYGRRLVAENIYANGYVAPTAGVWNAWHTAAGPNQLTFYDSNHNGGTLGFYGAPTLADLKAGSINWSTWPTNPTAGTSDPNPFDYGAAPVNIISFQTGSGWAAFEGWLDDVQINLTTGDTYILDFEGPTDPLYVDDSWPATTPVGVEVAPGRWFGFNAFHYGQNALDVAIPGGTVNVAAGTYEEQLTIAGKNLLLKGAGEGLTTVWSPLSLTTQFTVGGNPGKPVIGVLNATDVRIEDLTVDGLGRGNSNYRMNGIAYYEAGGRVKHVTITGIRETPFNGNQHGVGLYAYNLSGGPFALEADDVTVVDFQKNGMALGGNGLTVNVHDCATVGQGPTTLNAQNGIQVGFGAQGTVASSAMSNVEYTPASYAASGLLVYQPGGPVNATGLTGANALVNCQAPVSWYDGSGLIDGIEVVGGSTWGPIFVFNSSAGPAPGRARPTTLAGVTRAPASPLEETASAPRDGGRGPQTFATYNVTIQNGCLTGADLAGSAGVYAYSLGGPLAVLVQNCNLADWDYGLVADGAAATLTANDNSITSSATAGYDNGLSGAAQNAEHNWWGDATGPGGAGGGLGDAVLPAVASNVDFTPWLTTGADIQPGCGFAPGPDNVIVAGPASGCITPTTPCLTIPVTITRTTSEPIRGFSVDVTLSGNLALCGSISEGTYLSSVGLTAFQVVGTGPTYTVDCAILGLPCGAGGGGGMLFDLPVTSLAPGGTGTVTISSVTLRDCDNSPVAGTGGAPLSITIDNVVPAALAISAAQVKTGNDGDGTTKITVSWPSAPGSDEVRVYRAPFGNYPEYDDAPGAGSVPAIPSWPPGTPWALAGTVTGGTSLVDEPPARDFWYYVAFVADACGSVGPVSNRTGGTLDYHLGDVAPGGGNNLVSTMDVADLGLHYGITIGPGDPFNYLDVGPTTDFTVDARPTTDNRIQFEDLMMFAINYGLVSAPQNRALPVASAATSVALDVPKTPAVGETFAVGVRLAGAGDVKGLSLALGWNAAAVEPVAVEAGELLARQTGQAVALSAAPGSVDLAALGTGVGFVGSGEAARITFRVRGPGDASIALRSVDARDLGNRRITLGSAPATAEVQASRTALGVIVPNPFHGLTTVHFALRQAMPVRLDVYDVSGRRVRTLAEGMLGAGPQRATWDGKDETGLALSSGFYVIRMQAGDVVQTRQVRLVR